MAKEDTKKPVAAKPAKAELWEAKDGTTFVAKHYAVSYSQDKGLDPSKVKKA